MSSTHESVSATRRRKEVVHDILNNTQKWKINENNSLKSGTRSSIFWSKKTKPSAPSIIGTKSKAKPYSIGTTYKGEWKLNKKHGFGCQIWAKGNKYEGQWEEGYRHGRGSFWVMEGKKLRKQYTGSWKRGLKDGLGVYFYKNGDRYEGEWHNGLRSGKGTLFTHDGQQYNGMWREDQQNGFGRLVKANGDVYRGQWLNGKREGSGIYYFKSKQSVYDGEWVNDMPKCGINMDAKDYLSQGKKDVNLDAKFEPIPILRVKDSDDILIKRIEQIELERHAARNVAFIELESEFGEEELDEMRRAYSVVDLNGNGLIDASEMAKLLHNIDLPASEDDVARVMVDLDKNSDSKLSFQEFAKGVHLIKHLVTIKKKQQQKDRSEM